MIPSKLHPLANPTNSAETREAIIRFLMRVWGDYHPSEYTFVGTMNDNELWKDHTIRGDRKNKITTILENYPADRYNLYFCPNSFFKQERKAIFANGTRYAWCDIDDNSVANYDPQPDILWQTSPGRHQGLWIWDQAYPGDVAEQYSRNIVTKDGGDKGGWSVTKMLRIPGTRNLKPKYDRPWVKLLSFSADQQRLPTRLAAIRPMAPKAAIIGSTDLTGLDSKEIIQRYRKRLERCNNYCLMCSQPPRDVDDTWVADEALEAIPLVSRDAREIGFTGGEPTLLGEKFIELIKVANAFLPNTALHILSNGRSFAQGELAAQVGAIGHHDLMIGIPIYSDLAHLHDHVVQADGAFDETIRGVLALKACGVRVEIRVVLQAQTVERLAKLATFISRNLLFVDHVALMGLEPIGFARANLQQIWVDPVDYAPQLSDAVRILTDAGLRVSIYNGQLCVIPKALWPIARKSISDWKNEFLPECESCAAKHNCPGFFASARYANPHNSSS